MFNFFKKDKSNIESKSISLKQRLTKSRQKLGSGLTALLLGKKSIDDDLLEALEMLLIGADIGINTTDKVLESVRKNASRKTLKDTDSLYQFLKDELAGLLIEDNQLKSDQQSCSTAAARKVSPAASITDFP
jgi:fused signal recognition particle receptor